MTDTATAVAALARARGITEVLHFTTHRGLLGIFAKGAVLSRQRLAEEEYLEHVYTPNCASRLKDGAYLDYVNLSVSRVNKWMLDKSMGWHDTEDVWWAVLGLDAALLAHPGVLFATTNNSYPVVRRAPGVEGLAALFDDAVPYGYYGSVARRGRGTPSSWTTDPQAEMLYPGEVPLDLLRSVYTREPEHLDTIRGWVGTFPSVRRVRVECQPGIFQ